MRWTTLISPCLIWFYAIYMVIYVFVYLCYLCLIIQQFSAMRPGQRMLLQQTMQPSIQYHQGKGDLRLVGFFLPLISCFSILYIYYSATDEKKFNSQGLLMFWSSVGWMKMLMRKCFDMNSRSMLQSRYDILLVWLAKTICLVSVDCSLILSAGSSPC